MVTGLGAPPVVAVVVTRDPGDWFERTLESLDAQDYPQLSVLVIDNGSSTDPTPRVADVLPGAFVKRLKADEGFSRAANESLHSVQGAPFLLICHDDVRLAPDAVTQLVAEAFRSNAGVVGPKLVDWDRTDVLRSVGLSVDRYGAPTELVDADELDQSQHDRSRAVFAVSDACVLVRADLFSTVSGFSDAIPYFGEDVDLCWKAHIAGATVQFCHRARVAHRGRFDDRRPTDVRDRLELRNQARMTMANHSFAALFRFVPAAALLSLFEFGATLLMGRGRNAVDILATWGWVVTHPVEVVRARRRRSPYRRSGEGVWLPLMRRGSNRMRALAGSREGEGRVAAATRAGRERFLAPTADLSRSRLAVAVAVSVPLLLFLGARSLWLGDLPSMREFTSLGDSVGALWSEWWTAWRPPGLGEGAVAPGAIPGLGLLGTVLAFSAGAARRVLLLLPLVLGPVGAWRLVPANLSPRAKAAAMATYGLSPIALNAVGEARLQALVAYAVAPFVLRRVARRAGIEPFAPAQLRLGPRWRHMAGTGLLLALVGAVSPLAAAVIALACVAVLVGPALAGQGRAAAGAMGQTVAALAIAAIANGPWLVEAVRRGDAGTLTGLWESRAPVPSAAEMLTGSIGPVGVGWLGWGIVIAAVVPLITGRGWRFGWAAGGWTAVVVGLGIASAAGAGDLVGGAGVAVLLVPVALGLAVAVAMGPLAFETDVVRSDFGSPQLLSFLGLVALFVGLLPVVVAVTEGRWYLPEGDFDRGLEVVDDGDDFRTLWIGDPDVLPMSGWPVGSVPGVAIATSQGMTPTMSERYRLDGGEPIEVIRAALAEAFEGGTARVGRDLAPLSVRYVLVVDRPAPEPFAAAEVPMPRGVVASLEEQLDLRRILVGPGVDLFEISYAWPLRSDLTQPPEPGTAPPAVFGRDFGTRFTDELEGPATIAQSVTGDPGWSLTVDGEEAVRTDLGLVQQFEVAEGGGEATLAWSTSWFLRAMQLVQVVAVGALVVVASRRGSMPTPPRRRRVDRPDEPLVVVEAQGEQLGDWSERRPAPVDGSPQDAEDGPEAAEDGPDAGDGGADAEDGPDAGDGVADAEDGPEAVDAVADADREEPR